MVNADNQQREVVLFGDSSELERMVQGAHRASGLCARRTAALCLLTARPQPAINLTVQALVATLSPEPAKTKAHEPAPGASGTAPAGGADKGGPAPSAASTAAPIKRWGKPPASSAAQSSTTVRAVCMPAACKAKAPHQVD